MVQLESALELAMKRRASDVHFSVGRPIMIRVDGTLLQLNDEVLKPNDIKDAFTPILTDAQREKIETLGEVDFAYSLKGVGRFRLNREERMQRPYVCFRSRFRPRNRWGFPRR